MSRSPIVISSNGRYLPITATREDYDGAPDAHDLSGHGRTRAEAVANLIGQEADRRGLDSFSLTVTLTGQCSSVPDEPSVNYRGYVEVATVELDGLTFAAADFPEAFVKALQRRLA